MPAVFLFLALIYFIFFSDALHDVIQIIVGGILFSLAAICPPIGVPLLLIIGFLITH